MTPPATPGASDAARLGRERDFHKRIAPNAEAVWNWASASGQRRAARRAAFFVAALDRTSPTLALELGCGSGVFLEHAVATRASVVAIDLSPELLARARERVAHQGRARLACANAQRLPFPDACFDVVFGSSILHHLDLEVTLAELHRILRPQGRLVFAEPNLLNPQIALQFLLLPRRFCGLTPDEMAFSRFRIRRLLAAAGFVDVTSEPYDFLHPAIPGALSAAVESLSRWLERVPLVREIAGSQILAARRP